jgi:mannosyltransferase
MKKHLISIVHRTQSIPSIDWIVLAVGLALFGLLCAVTLSTSSIWFDEAFSVYLTHFNYIEIARYTATDVHPPFYYWVLKAWVDCFGSTEVAFRSLSVVFGMSAITFGFLLVKRLFGRRAAWLSLLLLVLSPMLIRYGQEARMYTLAATITLAATYVLTFAMQSNRRRTWVLYGLLVSLGMWTHYFTAVVWLAHWVWRAVVVRQTGVRGAAYAKAFFSKNWIIAHVIAVGLFLPWVPFMVIQLTTIQSTGFWIPPISADTLTNYLSNVLFYLQHDEVLGWFALVLMVVCTGLGVLGVKLYLSMNKVQRQNYLLIIAIAFIPVAILLLVSMPPLKSSFVERYLIPSAAGFAMFAGVTLALGMQMLRPLWRIIITGLVVACMIFGISNVYYYGNYNKNSNVKVTTGQLVKDIQAKAGEGEPIIANSPWVFYEAIFYTSDRNPVYFIDATTEYIYGSLDMLKYSDEHKIKDLTAFTNKNPIVWYIGNVGDNDIEPPVTTWKPLQDISVFDPIDKKDPYKGVQYLTN